MAPFADDDDEEATVSQITLDDYAPANASLDAVIWHSVSQYVKLLHPKPFSKVAGGIADENMDPTKHLLFSRLSSRCSLCDG